MKLNELLLCFFDIKRYLKNNEQDQKGKTSYKTFKKKGKGINELNE